MHPSNVVGELKQQVSLTEHWKCREQGRIIYRGKIYYGHNPYLRVQKRYSKLQPGKGVILARQQNKTVPSKDIAFKKAGREYFLQNDLAQKGKDRASKIRSSQITRPCMLGMQSFQKLQTEPVEAFQYGNGSDQISILERSQYNVMGSLWLGNTGSKHQFWNSISCPITYLEILTRYFLCARHWCIV